ncbi:MAG: hypothetical protein HY360_07180, partial [Verrucomicrobia bacterium]|nr:hypothetical protein [Verrucomicrobiota bacterium]
MSGIYRVQTRRASPGTNPSSSFRFFAETATDAELKAAHAAILQGKPADLRRDVFQTPQAAPRNANVHKPATPRQGVLLLAKSA